jgi:hypothetical protein
MAGKKRIDPVKQREKRAKIAAGVGAVLLLLVAAFEVPKIMKMMHPKPVVPPPTNVAAPDGSVPASTTPTTGETPSGQLADTDVPPPDATGQLVAFDVFETKDPFRPQVTASDTTGDTSSPTDTTQTSTTPADTTPAATDGGTSGGSTPPTAVPSTPAPGTTTSTTPTSTVPVRVTVAISVNGVVAHVSSGGVFPAGAPVFRLVSWTKGAARVGIVGGSYATGDPTLGLTIGKPVTLQNTSDDKQYKLVLLSTP